MITVAELANRLRVADEARNWEATWNDLAATAINAITASATVEWSIVMTATGKRIRCPDEGSAKLLAVIVRPKVAVVGSRLVTEWAT